jgi:hypothetical protein
VLNSASSGEPSLKDAMRRSSSTIRCRISPIFSGVMFAGVTSVSAT